jgi:hypothetical protein
VGARASVTAKVVQSGMRGFLGEGGTISANHPTTSGSSCIPAVRSIAPASVTRTSAS